MDLLFKRYASPFLFIDGMIETERFLDFTIEFINQTNEDTLYQLWLHKIFDKSYEEWKRSVENKKQKNMTEKEFETSIDVALSVFDKL